jgi:hypothetical protein
VPGEDHRAELGHRLAAQHGVGEAQVAHHRDAVDVPEVVERHRVQQRGVGGLEHAPVDQGVVHEAAPEHVLPAPPPRALHAAAHVVGAEQQLRRRQAAGRHDDRGRPQDQLAPATRARQHLGHAARARVGRSSTA